jgi:hypothetical protein
MKLDAVVAALVAGGLIAADKAPDAIKAALAADRKAKDASRAKDEAEEAEDEYAEGMDTKAAAMDSAEEEADKDKTDEKAKDRKAARDSRKAARDARKGARDARRAARDARKGRDENTDPERTNDNELGSGNEPGTPAKTGKSESGALDSAEVDRRIAAAVAAATAGRDELHTATREVESIVGVRAFDSAGDAYKAALETLGVDIAGVHPSAYRAMLKIAKDSRGSAPPVALATDEASATEIAARIPHLNRL